MLHVVVSTALLPMAITRAFPLQQARLAGYSHDAGAVTVNPAWMARLQDSTLLSELSIPGTHDTMALYGGDAAVTQSMSLDEQLYSGIRAVDIRCAHVNNTCSVHHGIVDQHADLETVLSTLGRFLADNRKEAVLMRIGCAGAAASGNTRTWEETWKSYAQRHNAMRTKKQGPLFWPDGLGQCGTGFNPTLGDVRGRVVILQDFGIRWPACFGIPYPDAFSVQDHWELKSNWDLYKKWESVKGKLDEAASSPRRYLHMNYLSAASGAFPYFVSSGQQDPATGSPRLLTGETTSSCHDKWPDFPRVHCLMGECSIAFEGTNNLATQTLAGKKGRVGVIMADFPGPALINQVIAQNLQTADERLSDG